MNHKHISNLSINISTHAALLTPMEKEMLQELMRKKNQFTYQNFTIVNIAETLNVSTTSLHRLSKKLGYSSFAFFKEDFFAKNDVVTESDEFHDYLEMITDTYYLVEKTITEEMIEALSQAQKITIYGMGMSSYIGKIFQIKLQLLGVLAEQYDDSRFMKLSSRVLETKKDIVIILSRSGCPPELIEVMGEINNRGVDSILITESQDSPLANMATYVVNTSHALDNDDDVDTRVNAHIAMDIIIKNYLSYTKKGKRENEELL